MEFFICHPPGLLQKLVPEVPRERVIYFVSGEAPIGGMCLLCFTHRRAVPSDRPWLAACMRSRCSTGPGNLFVIRFAVAERRPRARDRGSAVGRQAGRVYHRC